ncbi:MAG: RNA methyltransferase [Caulobacteraceae bacterium]|nr:RNA methyltransferase [Caulobacteraceae bacterium]
MTAVSWIEDADDPRIEPYRQVRERDLVGREGGFILEGEVVLRAFAAAGRHELVSVLLAEKRLEKLAPILEALPAAPVYVAAQPVLDAIVGFHIHRGVLALGRRARPLAAAELLASVDEAGVVAALFGVGNHDNMGAIFRNAAAFGAAGVLLDGACCDPLYRKAIRVSVGAALTMPFARLEPQEDPVELLARHGFEAFALSPRGAVDLKDVTRSGRSALLLGAEGPGLPPAILAAARSVAIPMTGTLDSLNVATSSGIALHHLLQVAPVQKRG